MCYIYGVSVLHQHNMLGIGIRLIYIVLVKYFPSYFAKRHLMGVLEFIKLQTSDGKQRSARGVYRGDGAKLIQGWYEFALENNLGKGDVCVFEVLKLSDIVLKVTVFRVLESDSQSKRCKIEVLHEKYNRPKVGKPFLFTYPFPRTMLGNIIFFQH